MPGPVYASLASDRIPGRTESPQIETGGFHHLHRQPINVAGWRATTPVLWSGAKPLVLERWILPAGSCVSPRREWGLAALAQLLVAPVPPTQTSWEQTTALQRTPSIHASILGAPAQAQPTSSTRTRSTPLPFERPSQLQIRTRPDLNPPHQPRLPARWVYASRRPERIVSDVDHSNRVQLVTRVLEVVDFVRSLGR